MYLVTISNALQQERTYVELLCHYQGKWTYIYKFLVTICTVCTHITTCMYLAALNYWVKVNTSAKCPTLLFSPIDIVHLSKQYNFVYLVRWQLLFFKLVRNNCNLCKQKIFILCRKNLLCTYVFTLHFTAHLQHLQLNRYVFVLFSQLFTLIYHNFYPFIP